VEYVYLLTLPNEGGRRADAQCAVTRQ